MLRRGLLLAALAALLFPSSALAGPADDARQIRRGLNAAVAAGRLAPEEAARYRMTVRRCRSVLALLPASRRHALAFVLDEVADQAPRFTRARALALFGMLAANTEYLSVNPVPARKTDVYDDDGVLYRSGWGGLQFHPLGNFALLNGHVSGERPQKASRLANALAARGVAQGRGSVWEYYFPFGGGSPPWTSGMAQAAGAQALGRAGAMLQDKRLLATAARAFRAIPRRLLLRLSAGPWIQHYSFSGLVVLNAQLQSAISLQMYADASGNGAAARLAARLRRSASALFSRFDTGYWSRYSLGVDSSLHYHLYVIDLLRGLARRTGNPVWQRRADRFQRYVREPPRFAAPRFYPAVYPVPADGFRDHARIRFWVSKISTVRLRVAGYRQAATLSGGWHTFLWWPGRTAPGRYVPHVTAVDLAGNRAEAHLPAVRVRRGRASSAFRLAAPLPVAGGRLVAPKPAPDVDALP